MDDSQQQSVPTNDPVPVDAGAQPPQSIPPAAADPAPQQPTVPTPQPVPGAPVAPTVAGTPDAADDVDLIEKAWVEKAKDIVHQTGNDPFTQSQQINHMKADYIKKRYNKDIRVE